MKRRHNDSDINTEVFCIFCREVYIPHDAGLCKECCDGVVKAEEDLLEEINVLKAKVDFLSLSSSLDLGSNSRSFTDVVLIASNADGAASPPIPAHKVVLVSRSPVFKAMLENEKEENCCGTITISEVSYGTLRKFVNYLYTAEVSLDEKMACDLLVMSEKYQVKHLKSHCEKFLVTNLSSEKSLMVYVFAQQHNTKHLLDAALLKIIEDMETVTKSEAYMELVKKDPRLVVEIYEAYILKQVKTAARGQNYVSGESMNLISSSFQCWLGDQFIQLL